MIETNRLYGLKVIESELLPRPPTDAQWVHRYVRHGMSDVLDWLGEPVGPHPDDQTHVIIAGDTILASATIVSRMKKL